MSTSLLKQIREEIVRLEQDLEALRVAEKALMATIDVPSQSARRVSVNLVPGSIKEAVVNLLQKNVEGLPALEILAKLKDTTHPDLIRTSLSPQLSRLKQAGMLNYKDKIWFLADKREEDGF